MTISLLINNQKGGSARPPILRAVRGDIALSIIGEKVFRRHMSNWLLLPCTMGSSRDLEVNTELPDIGHIV